MTGKVYKFMTDGEDANDWTNKINKIAAKCS